MTKLQSILKSRDFTLLTKVQIVNAMVFLVVIYGWLLVVRYGESWTIKKAEYQRMDTFELWCWKRLLRVSWTAMRSNQSILKEISPEYHWKDWCWSSNSLATWCKELTHLKRHWCWERFNAGGEGNKRGLDGWMTSSTWVNSRSWWWTGKPDVLQSMGSQWVGYDWVTELNWGTFWCSLKSETHCSRG